MFKFFCFDLFCLFEARFTTRTERRREQPWTSCTRLIVLAMAILHREVAGSLANFIGMSNFVEPKLFLPFKTKTLWSRSEGHFCHALGRRSRPRSSLRHPKIINSYLPHIYLMNQVFLEHKQDHFKSPCFHFMVLEILHVRTAVK